MRLSENEYHIIYDQISHTLQEDVGLPNNFNLLNHNQLMLIESIVDITMDRYAGVYIDLLESFREDLASLSNQAKEVINDVRR